MSKILIDAEVLKRSSEQKEFLKKTINHILRSLMDDIKKAKQAYKNSVDTSLPITFSVPGLSNKDSQRIVWFNVIKELNASNYRVKIKPSKDKCTLRIIWVSEEEEMVIREQMDLIASHVDHSL